MVDGGTRAASSARSTVRSRRATPIRCRRWPSSIPTTRRGSASGSRGERLKVQVDYWRRALADAPDILDLPTDRPRPAQQSFVGDGVELDLDAELTRGLKAVSQRHGTTLFMTVLAAWAVVLGRLSGQDDIVIGVPAANRGRREVEGLIGFFVNTLALRIDLSGRAERDRAARSRPRRDARRAGPSGSSVRAGRGADLAGSSARPHAVVPGHVRPGRATRRRGSICPGWTSSSRARPRTG